VGTTVETFGGIDILVNNAGILVLGTVAGGLGGPLAAKSLANLLAVHLIRHILAPRQPTRRRYGALPRGRLRAVVEYIEEHLDGSPSLEQMAATAHLSVYHFARQFRAATGLPPHQYVISRRVERAKQLLQEGDLSLAEVAAAAWAQLCFSTRASAGRARLLSLRTPWQPEHSGTSLTARPW
jgi:AraC family transcriptional regulator